MQTLTAREAADCLGITLSTLYAYVSRGLLHTLPGDTPRARRYLLHEVQTLQQQRRRGRKSRDVARTALDWGLPVLPSAITLIDQGRLFFRGHDAALLAQQVTLEQLAALLWQTPSLPLPTDRAWQAAGTSARLADPEWLLTRFVTLSADLPADCGTATPARQAGNHVQLMATLAAALCDVWLPGLPLHQWCAQAWGLDKRDAERVRMALVLCADHELNPSSFAARCATASGASTRSALIAALATLSGGRHGGATARVMALLKEIGTGDVAHTVTARQLRGEDIPGFGHPLYPQGDPRARQILSGLTLDHVSEQLQRHMAESTGLLPSLDFALVALCRSLALPEGAAFGLFALGRSVGWLAHIDEQRTSRQPIRPRAQYSGPMPPVQSS
ncbi:citrate synthase family protein [Paludibacterium sp. B53371]|uniref:citrate synthase family protein n=1 Tax=Paludibacterium sp. B53371 TaxID=2806263 RepID=UPI001C04364C|nr:citrate synthase family protein [Paludibacterium sp. B53371]